MEDVRDKIAKLMAMATDGRGNEFEAEAAMRLAERLMRKHGIEVAELQARTGQKPVYQWARVCVPAGKPPLQTLPGWLGSMAVGIAIFTDCSAIQKEVQGHGRCVEFRGEEMDVQYAVWLMKHLRDDCRRQSAAYEPTYNARRERETWRVGYSSRVTSRLKALKRERDDALREAVVTATGNALVVVEDKIALRDAEFGDVRYGRTGKRRSGESWAAEAGRAAGDRVGLGRPIGGASKLRS